MHDPKLTGSYQSCTLAAGTQSFPLQPDHARVRETLIYLFLASLILLCIVGLLVAYQYTTPQRQWGKLGNVDDFATAEPVLAGIDGTHVWVVNTGEGFVALHAIPNDSTRCHILWDPHWQQLVDPCRGSRYTATGIFTIEGPPPDRALNRYPIRIDDKGDLYIETTSPILGLSFEQVKQACKAQTAPAWYGEESWWEYCDFNAIGLEQVEGIVQYTREE